MVTAWTDNGEPLTMSGTYQDITDRKRTENALSESEERFRTLYLAMLEGVCLHEVVYDTQGNIFNYRFIDVNPAYEKIIGRRESQLLGKRPPKCVKRRRPLTWIFTLRW